MTGRATLLVNLGSPRSPAVDDVRRYLGEFLMDPHVIDLPWPLRRALVSGVILPTRPKRSAEAYARIWSDAGSPLIAHSRALAAALASRLGGGVYLAMRYGEPGIAAAIAAIADAGHRQLLLVPLYPQYAEATHKTSIEAVRAAVVSSGIDVDVLPAFHADAGYLDAQAELIRPCLGDSGHLLLSYHGLPERAVRRTDPTRSHCLRHTDCCEAASVAHTTCYRQQCLATTRGLRARLGLAVSQVTTAFQSRLGRARWLSPYTDTLLRELPARGVRRLTVAAPAFVADNLETLEELGMRGRETFLAAGGESLTLVPCLNASAPWVSALATLIERRP